MLALTHALGLILPLGHGGHLLLDLPVFLGPILVLGGWLGVAALSGRRLRRRS